ncbi:MAG: TRAP transporter small permease [Eubacteriales bacterium]|jgi:TRAP-type C4-dicarboxylate transport system permease small subunit
MRKVVDFIIDRILANILKVLGILLFGVVVIQIVARYCLPSPLTWTEEVGRLIFIWFAYLASVMTAKKKGHIGIDYLYNKMKVATRQKLDVFIYFLTCIFGLVVAVNGTILLDMVAMQKSPILRMPMTWFYLVLPITGALILLVALDYLIEAVQVCRKGDAK